MKYRKKPVVIEAVKWTGTNITEIQRFISDSAYRFSDSGELYIDTLEGEHRASVGDYIIKGVQGEFYPCKPDIFEQTYEAVTISAQQERNNPLTLDGAISHLDDMLAQREWSCEECRLEHVQLREWLVELHNIKERERKEGRK